MTNSLKLCNGCKKNIDIINFDRYYHNKRKKYYYRSKCKECRKNENNKYRKNKVLSEIKEKKCSICKLIKKENNFYKVGSICKECTKTDRKEYYENNKEKIKYEFIICNNCKYEKYGTAFRFNRKICLECEKKYGREYNKKNKNIRNNWNINNKDKLLNYSLKRRNKNINVKNISNNILKEWIEFNFTDDMNWENHGFIWHLDHTLPLSKFKNENDLIIITDWINLFPLYKHLNLRKSNRICPFYIFLLEKRLREFSQIKKIDIEKKIKKLNRCFKKVLSIN